MDAEGGVGPPLGGFVSTAGRSLTSLPPTRAESTRPRVEALLPLLPLAGLALLPLLALGLLPPPTATGAPS